MNAHLPASLVGSVRVHFMYFEPVVGYTGGIVVSSWRIGVLLPWDVALCLRQVSLLGSLRRLVGARPHPRFSLEGAAPRRGAVQPCGTLFLTAFSLMCLDY